MLYHCNRQTSQLKNIKDWDFGHLFIIRSPTGEQGGTGLSSEIPKQCDKCLLGCSDKKGEEEVWIKYFILKKITFTSKYVPRNKSQEVVIH